MKKTERDFWKAYERLSESGRCDDPGGSEYDRVVGEWKQAGCPSNLDDFITVRANIGPDGTAWRAKMN